MALLIPFILLAVFFFLRANPQRRRAQAQRTMMGSLEPGTRVVTAAGAIGTLVGVSGDRAAIELAPGVVVEFLLAAVTRTLADTDDGTADEDGGDAAQVTDLDGHGHGHDTIDLDGRDHDAIEPAGHDAPVIDLDGHDADTAGALAPRPEES